MGSVMSFLLNYHRIINLLEIFLLSWGLVQIMGGTVWADLFRLEGDEYKAERKKRVKYGVLSLSILLITLIINLFIK